MKNHFFFTSCVFSRAHRWLKPSQSDLVAKHFSAYLCIAKKKLHEMKRIDAQQPHNGRNVWAFLSHSLFHMAICHEKRAHFMFIFHNQWCRLKRFCCCNLYMYLRFLVELWSSHGKTFKVARTRQVRSCKLWTHLSLQINENLPQMSYFLFTFPISIIHFVSNDAMAIPLCVLYTLTEVLCGKFSHFNIVSCKMK